jgi:hypothetical protein
MGLCVSSSQFENQNEVIEHLRNRMRENQLMIQNIKHECRIRENHINKLKNTQDNWISSIEYLQTAIHPNQ